MKHLQQTLLLGTMLLISNLATGQDAVKPGTVVEGLPKTHLEVVGGLGNLTAYQNFEEPFWTETIPELSQGRVTTSVRSFSEMGLKGPEILRLVSQGTMPFGT